MFGYLRLAPNVASTRMNAACLKKTVVLGRHSGYLQNVTHSLIQCNQPKLNLLFQYFVARPGFDCYIPCIGGVNISPCDQFWVVFLAIEFVPFGTSTCLFVSILFIQKARNFLAIYSIINSHVNRYRAISSFAVIILKWMQKIMR